MAGTRLLSAAWLLFCVAVAHADSTPRFTCAGVALTAAQVPRQCRSMNSLELCGVDGCIDRLAEAVAAQLLASGAQQLPCDVTPAEVQQCLGPLVKPLSQSGANLMGLMQCDQNAVAKRLAARFQCKL